MPKVSIIIPTYNSESTIEETIASVQQQSFTDWELIIIDDASQDNTVNVIKNIDEHRLKLFVYPNGGVGIARNRGIAKAKGEFLAFLDADDLWTHDKLTLQIEALNENPQAKVAYSWTSFIDKNGKFLFSGKALYYQGNIYQHLLLTNFLLSGSNILVRRDALQLVKGFNPDLPYAADWDFYLRLARIFDFAVVPKYQIFYRQSGNSMSSKIEQLKQQSLQVIDAAFQVSPVQFTCLQKQSHSILYLYCAELYRKKIKIENKQNLFDNKSIRFYLQNINNKKQDIFQIGHYLYLSIRLYPKSLLEKNTQRLLIKYLLIRFLILKITQNTLHLLFVNKETYIP